MEKDKVFVDRKNGFYYYYLTLSGRNSVVECHLAKVDVVGSNPIARSIFI